jgi:lipoprotein-releasing system ATP-binding protein
MSEAPVLELRRVTKAYEGAVRTEVLHGIDLKIEKGEFVALMGPSGSGKSTLLNIIGLLEHATSGEVLIEGADAQALGEAECTRLRGQKLGFVFQFHHLVSALTVAENLMVPLAVPTLTVRGGMHQQALDALSDLGLEAHAHKLPSQLSGGQQQRVAIARALMHNPALVLADEPTGNLDSETAFDVLALLRRYNRDKGMAFLLVTHDPRIAKECDRSVEIVDGRLVAEPSPTQAEVTL